MPVDAYRRRSTRLSTVSEQLKVGVLGSRGKVGQETTNWPVMIILLLC